MWLLAPFVACGYNKAEPGDLITLVPPSGDVIDATLCPRMAAKKTPRTKPHTTNDPVLLNGLKSVVRARRVVAAHIAIERRDDRAINPEDTYAYVSRK
jgi:hypothetical protein